MIFFGSEREQEGLGFLLEQVETEIMSGMELLLTPNEVAINFLRNLVDLRAYSLTLQVPRHVADEETPLNIDPYFGGHAAHINFTSVPTLRGMHAATPEAHRRAVYQGDFCYQSAVTTETTLEFTVVLRISFDRRQAYSLTVDGRNEPRTNIGPWAVIQWWCNLRRADFNPLNLIRNEN